MIEEYIKISIRNLLNRKLRTSLTIIGVIIGITAIVSLLTLGTGLREGIQEQFDTLGSNTISILPPQLFSGPQVDLGTTLNQKDIKAIENVKGVTEIREYLIKTLVVTYKNDQRLLTISGYDPKFEVFREAKINVKEGTFLNKNSNYEAIIGLTVAENFFDKEVKINSKIEINEKIFKVKGILEPTGSFENDQGIFIPIENLRTITSDNNGISTILVKTNQNADVTKIAGEIQSELEKIRNEESFTVLTADQLLQQTNQILTIAQSFLTGIATISLLIAAIGISNSMYTSVTEKTKEIGIMKSIGANSNDILKLFLTEAAIIGLIGGIIGTILGILLALLTQEILAQQGFGFIKITIQPLIILTGLTFATVFGIISGYIPSRQASKLKPTEALRK